MEQFLQYIKTNAPMIIECVLTIVAYFLIALFSSKIKSAKNYLHALFTEKADNVNRTDTALRKDMAKELEESKMAYKNAVDEIAELKQKQARVERVLNILVEEEVIDDGKLRIDEAD